MEREHHKQKMLLLNDHQKKNIYKKKTSQIDPFDCNTISIAVVILLPQKYTLVWTWVSEAFSN